jgi:hypothetical protein
MPEVLKAAGHGAALDQVAVRDLREALEASESASSTSCGFFACPGPDEPFAGMMTCHVCRTTQLLRRALKRLGITAD